MPLPIRPLRHHPHLIQINTAFFLARVSRRLGRPATLDEVPSGEWEALARAGFDLVWLMGVWKRSPKARLKALEYPELRGAYSLFLPDWTASDILGSPYAVYGYRPDPAFGDKDILGRLKEKLNALGMRLILDFVPNHLSLDHPWTGKFPQRFVRGTAKAAREHPDWFFQTKAGDRLAHGRDPYFGPWTDTVQVDFGSREMRDAMTDELLKIAGQSDGVRCDMAMLGLNEVFEKNWGTPAGRRRVPKEFWEEALEKVKSRFPDFIFMAEVYWDLEARLQEIGFDYTYDKKFYDALVIGAPERIRACLGRDPSYQAKAVRFLENHDEERAVSILGPEKSQAAAVLMASSPGMRFFQDGQSEGRRIRMPIQSGREPEAVPDEGLRDFYRRLLEFSNAPLMHDGEWKLLEIRPPAPAHASCPHLFACSWRRGEDWRVVIVNYSPAPAQGRILFDFPKTDGYVRLCDALTGQVYLRDFVALSREGLYVDLGPWQSHGFEPV